MTRDDTAQAPPWLGIMVASGFGAAAVVAAFAVSIATGWSPEHFQRVLPPAVFTADLVAAADAMRAILSIDAVFIAAYGVVFVLMYTAFRRRSPAAGALGLALIAVTIVLDLIENQLTLTAIGHVELGGALDADRVALSVLVSQVKFHAGYLGLVMFGVMLPGDTWLERALKVTLLYVQLPVGALVFTTDLAVFPLARTGLFVVGLATIAGVAARHTARQRGLCSLPD